MLSKTEAVWRYLLVDALEQGQSREPSITAVASDLGLGISTVHKALARPTEIGAVIVHPSRGVRIVDPWRLLILWAGKRKLSADVRLRTTTDIPVHEVESRIVRSGGVLSGFGGLVGKMGENPIAAYDSVIFYGDDLRGIPEAEDGATKLVMLEPDPLLEHYGRIAPLSQCWVDLFNTPGWQAARFVEERQLIDRFTRDVINELDSSAGDTPSSAPARAWQRGAAGVPL
jgi:hypothetical protein